jgi:hypothetical protein
MASFLNTRIHVDQYKYGLYFALTKSKELRAVEAAKLISTYCGNHLQVGCLTADATQARIHSCEAGTGCDILDQSKFADEYGWGCTDYERLRSDYADHI